MFTFENTYEIQDIITVQPNLILLNDCDFTEDAVIKVLDKIKVYKTPGPDCIIQHVLIKAKYQIYKPLMILFNTSLKSGRVLDIWKLANDIAIQKKV